MKSDIDTSSVSKPTLLILKHFYKLKVAEHEVVERLVTSTKEIGWIPRVVEVDSNFDFRNIQRIEKNVDAVLDIHYEYPKFFRAKSIGAFWTPTSFMKDWDLAYVWENQLSHDDIVFTDSDKILKLLNEFRPKEEFKILNHSLPGSWVEWINLAVRNNTPRAFYAGINWNKLSGRKGRNHELFKLLDDSDTLNLYGPKKISHVIPWDGFKSYRGEIPFDGKSILRRSRESGISLVLSSEQHFNEEMISSRFFEGLAAGNAIISDGHPFIRKYLGKYGFNLDLERGDDFAARQFLEFIAELRENTSLLIAHQEYSQNLFLEKFDLTLQLKNILEPKSETQPKAKIDALILGNSKSNLRAQLNKLGFGRIIHSNFLVQDLQDLVSLARSFNLKEFCVFYANTEVLDGFVTGLIELNEIMRLKDAQFGVLSSVALRQGGRKFAPVVMGKTGLAPLNGLVANLSLKNPTFVSPTKKIPFLRVEDISEIKYLSVFHDSYSFLIGVAEDYDGETGGSLRKSLQFEFDKKYSSNQRDPIEEIRLMPRARRRVLGYSLMAALPYTKPFAAIAKWLIRKNS